MAAEVFYVKSFEEDFATKTLIGKKKVSYQTIYDIVHTKKIKPNTLSFGRKRRLSTTILHDTYIKTYRPQGIIFQTSARPDYILPFDLVVLSATDNIIVHYYRIKNKLHIYYNHKLIPGFERFVFKTFDRLLNSISSPKNALEQINSFRKEKGFNPLPKSKSRLVEYNEAIFHKAISIKPVAIFGYRKDAKKIAKDLGLPWYTSAKAFYRR
jgi:hypothetical protein